MVGSSQAVIFFCSFYSHMLLTWHQSFIFNLKLTEHGINSIRSDLAMISELLRFLVQTDITSVKFDLILKRDVAFEDGYWRS